jgi:uncharacterized protein (TIGR03435 family)
MTTEETETMLSYPRLPRIVRRRLFAAASHVSLALSVAFMPTLAPIVAHAQAAHAKAGIEDTWQGTLHVPQGDQNRDLRTVLKVAKNPDNTLAVTMYSIDQGAGSIKASSARFQDGEFTYAIDRIDGTFDGKISADGKTITGEWKQGQGKSIPLIFIRATPDTEWAIPEAPKPVPMMPADADPAFEVVTVKPSNPDQQGKGFGVASGRISTRNTTLIDLIKFSYEVQEKQIVNAPDWAAIDKYDVSGQPDVVGTPSAAQMRSLMKKLLADRFQLTFHQDKREMPAYILTVAKSGSKLKKNDEGSTGLPMFMFAGLGVLNVANMELSSFCAAFGATVLDRPVVDQTGLTGKWDFALRWTPDESQFTGMGIKVPPPSEAAADARPPLFTAIQEQVGLRLDAGKAQVPVLILDKFAKPSEN